MDVRSDDINDYIKEITGEDSAKEFRTRNAIVAAALDGLGEAADLGQPSFQAAVEEAVLDLLEEERTSAIEKVA